MGCQVPLGPNYCFLSIILSLSDEHGYQLAVTWIDEGG